MSLIKQSSIEEVIDRAELLHYVGKYVDLKKEGSIHKACCPWHDEKTPSFIVSETKDLAKCFGCGESAVGAVSFIMKMEKLSWREAIEFIAKDLNITLEYEQIDVEQEEKYLKAVKSKASSYKLLEAANMYFIESLKGLPENHAVWKELSERRELSLETINSFNIGFAPENLQFITNKVIAKSIFDDAEKAGLVKKNETGKRYDEFINRITFPIYNTKGQIVSFGGQNMNTEKDADGKAKFVKYKNGKGTHVYNKKQTLYGLHLAKKFIQQQNLAIVAEGYYDVVSAHDKNLNNTVGTCGTAFSEEQADLLKKYCSRLLFIFDGDKAGIKALIRAMNIALAKGFQCKCIVLNDNADLDDFTRMYENEKLHNEIKSQAQDAVHWYSNYLITGVDSAFDKQNAAEQIAEVISLIPQKVTKTAYERSIAKILGADVPLAVFKELVKKSGESRISISKSDKSSGELDLPAHVDYDEWARFGFYEETAIGKAGYWFHEGGGNHVSHSNFVVKPLFHIYGSDNKRLIELNNGAERRIIEMPSKSLISLEQFCAVVYDEGHFLFTGTKKELMKILRKISDKFPKCHELKVLGWQKENFFAYSNVIFDGKDVIEMDNYGIAEFDDQKYFSPSVSDVYKDMRVDDDEFENDRFLVYKETNLTFKEWADLMAKVYPDHYIYAIAFVFIGLFKDLVYKIDNNCPHLSCYGQKGSGKSKLAESISAFFFQDMQPFNLNHGTDFAFANRLSRFRNCVTWFDEFDDGAIKEERFQSIKAAYDGAGRERGKGGKRNRTEIMHVNSALVLTGQYLSTRDDNAALTRCILQSFKPVSNDKRTKQEIANYTRLKEFEKAGLITGLLPSVLRHRKTVEKEYPIQFADNYNELRDFILNAKGNFKDRILRNYCAAYTLLKYLAPKLGMAVDLIDLKAMVSKDVMDLSNLIDESDALGGFWTIIEQLYEARMIDDGFHFRIIAASEVTLQDGRSAPETKTFVGIKQLLMLRVKAIHGLYSESARKQGSNQINLQSLKLYMESSSAFIGKSGRTKFKTIKGTETNTSCYVFDYEKLGIELQTLSGGNESNEDSNNDDDSNNTPF